MSMSLLKSLKAELLTPRWMQLQTEQPMQESKPRYLAFTPLVCYLNRFDTLPISAKDATLRIAATFLDTLQLPLLQGDITDVCMAGLVTDPHSMCTAAARCVVVVLPDDAALVAAARKDTVVCTWLPQGTYSTDGNSTRVHVRGLPSFSDVMFAEVPADVLAACDADEDMRQDDAAKPPLFVSYEFVLSSCEFGMWCCPEDYALTDQLKMCSSNWERARLLQPRCMPNYRLALAQLVKGLGDSLPSQSRKRLRVCDPRDGWRRAMELLSWRAPVSDSNTDYWIPAKPEAVGIVGEASTLAEHEASAYSNEITGQLSQRLGREINDIQAPLPLSAVISSRSHTTTSSASPPKVFTDALRAYCLPLREEAFNAAEGDTTAALLHLVNEHAPILHQLQDDPNAIASMWESIHKSTTTEVGMNDAFNRNSKGTASVSATSTAAAFCAIDCRTLQLNHQQERMTNMVKTSSCDDCRSKRVRSSKLGFRRFAAKVNRCLSLHLMSLDRALLAVEQAVVEGLSSSEQTMPLNDESTYSDPL